MSTNGSGLNLSSFSGFDRNRNNSGQQAEQEKAEFWLNIGYETQVESDEGKVETIFISLARGIPLDSIKPFDVAKSGTANMAQLRDAQNGLHESFMAEARALEPGESKLLIVDADIGLAVQVKRVKAEQAVPQENTLRKVVSFQRPIVEPEVAAKQSKAG
jgi:hypothetical protein